MKKADRFKGKDETLDTFYCGRILVLQKKKGYRFSLDAPLLADFIQTREGEQILELGTGNGIISLLLSIKPFQTLTALEIQKNLADLARRNIQLNQLEERIRIIENDFLSFHPGCKFDVIFSNPPYIKKNGGHLSEFQEKSIAKHELTCDISAIMLKTAELLKKKGRAYFVFPEKRRKDFMEAVDNHGLKVNTVRLVFPRPGTEPNLFLSEISFQFRPLIFLPPLVLYDEAGKSSSEAEKIFAGRIHV